MNLIGKLYYLITGDTSGLDKSLKKTDGQVKESGKGLTNLGKIVSGAAVAGAFVIAAKKVLDFGRAALFAAADSAEATNAVTVVFGEASDSILGFAEKSVDAVGLSGTAFKELATVTGAQLKNAGTGVEELGGQVIDLTKRAADVASVFNTEVDDALGAFNAALRGEAEPARRFAVNISDAAVQAEALASGLVDTKAEITDSIKVQARYNLILKQTESFANDFINTQDSFTNQLKIAASATDDLKAALGESLIPIATESVSVFGGLTRKLTEFIEERNRLKNIEEAAATGKGSVSDQIDGLRRLNDNITANIQTTKAAIQQGYVQEEQGRSLISTYEAEIAANSQKIANLTLEQKVRAGLNESLKESEVKAAAEADATEKRLTAQQEYIAFIEDEYSGTEQAKLEQLQAELALIEENIDSYGGLREEQLILIDLKKAEIEAIQEQIATDNEQTDIVAANVAIRQAARAEEQNQEELTAIAIEDRNVRIAESEAELFAARFLAYQTFFGGISALANAFSAQTKNQFIAQQAFSSAEAAINSYLAFTQVLADPSFIGRPFLRATAAAGALASGLAQQVKILSTPMPAFANGGIVPGSSFSGDNVLTRQNSGEMDLTMRQQRNLFDMINAGNGGNQTIIIRIGNTDFAKATVNALNSGAGGVVDARVVR